MVAVDMDGTLLGPSPPISLRALRAIRDVRDAGVTVMFVTSRTSRWVSRISDEATLGGTTICSSGAAVFDLDAKIMVKCYPIEGATARRFAHRCRSYLGRVAFAWETPDGAFGDSSLHDLPSSFASIQAEYSALGCVDQLSDSAVVTKIVIHSQMLQAEHLLITLRPLLGSRLSGAVSGQSVVDVTGAGVSKVRTLRILCAELGVPREEVVAVGDSIGDIPMLIWAGRGVAMGNSHPKVLAAVRERTATNVDDGLAIVLESVLVR